MSAHTPAPWRVFYDDVQGNDTQDQYVVMADSPTKPNDAADVCLCEPDHEAGISHSMAHANARLIAVAPEMLAGLRELTDWMRARTGPKDGTLDMLVRAVAVIAKAEGSQLQP